MARRPSLRDRDTSSKSTSTPTSPAARPEHTLSSRDNAAIAGTAPSHAIPEATTPIPRRRLEPTTSIGVYLTASLFQDARAAFLADWRTLPVSPDNFGRWVASAVSKHLERSRAARQRLDEAHTHGGDVMHEPRISRAFNLPVALMDRVDDTVAGDAEHDYATNRSDLIRVAISAAVTDATERLGTALPTPPSRLPNRLT